MSSDAKNIISSSLHNLSLIKGRMITLREILSSVDCGQISYVLLSNIDCGYLCVRKIIEELMLLSVCAHIEAGAEISKKILKQYRPSDRDASMGAINEKFFPDAFDIVPIEDPNILGKFIEVDAPYLDVEFSKNMYKVANSILHSDYRYIDEGDYKIRVDNLKDFYARSERLLRNFQIDTSKYGIVFLGQLCLDEYGPPKLYTGESKSLA